MLSANSLRTTNFRFVDVFDAKKKKLLNGPRMPRDGCLHPRQILGLRYADILTQRERGGNHAAKKILQPQSMKPDRRASYLYLFGIPDRQGKTLCILALDNGVHETALHLCWRRSSKSELPCDGGIFSHLLR